jgi:hypothetical protein
LIGRKSKPAGKAGITRLDRVATPQRLMLVGYSKNNVAFASLLYNNLRGGEMFET